MPSVRNPKPAVPSNPRAVHEHSPWGMFTGHHFNRPSFVDTMTKPLHLNLYVTGETLSSRQAIENLHAILKTEYAGEYELEVIDILKHPQLAEEEKILATPALIKELPEPVRRIVGDLADREKVLLGLDLHSKVSSSSRDEEDSSHG